MKKQEILKIAALIFLSPLLLGVLLILLCFILLLVPPAGFVFLGYTAINTINDIHRRNKNFKLKLIKNDREISLYTR